MAEPRTISPPPISVTPDDGVLHLVAYTNVTGTNAFYAAGTKRNLHIIKRILVTNPTGGSVNVTVTLYQAASATVFEIYPQTSLASKGRLPIPAQEGNDLDFALVAGDELRITGDGLTAFAVARVYQGNNS